MGRTGCHLMREREEQRNGGSGSNRNETDEAALTTITNRSLFDWYDNDGMSVFVPAKTLLSWVAVKALSEQNFGAVKRVLQHVVVNA